MANNGKRYDLANNSSSGTVDARSNYWGAATGPTAQQTSGSVTDLVGRLTEMASALPLLGVFMLTTCGSLQLASCRRSG